MFRVPFARRCVMTLSVVGVRHTALWERPRTVHLASTALQPDEGSKEFRYSWFACDRGLYVPGLGRMLSARAAPTSDSSTITVSTHDRSDPEMKGNA
jgi:hypothetical protein